MSPSPVPLQPPLLDPEARIEEDNEPDLSVADWFAHDYHGEPYHKPGDVIYYPPEGGSIDEGGGDLQIPPPNREEGRDGKPFDGF